MATTAGNKLDAAALLMSAQAETGLSDWGDPQFPDLS